MHSSLNKSVGLKTLILLSIHLAILVFSSCRNNNASSVVDSTSKSDLLDAIDTFNTAFRDGDVTTLSSMITENYVHTNGNSSPITKNEWLAYMNERTESIEAGVLKILDYRMEDISVEMYDKMAIVTAKVIVSSLKEEQVDTAEFRVTNVWTYSDKKWKRAAFHDGKIK